MFLRKQKIAICIYLQLRIVILKKSITSLQVYKFIETYCSPRAEVKTYRYTVRI